ncbi:AMP-binding protein [Gilvimarinus polysaccharolyticus]|uniref:AMP-binding protein n=1 Tax=Gilvimarinus polysaccharolyticus TaxID=863921 RepID=UPI0006738B8B|nr:AMP-binding protein [Gilvimarinus polysaccharolyticus]
MSTSVNFRAAGLAGGSQTVAWTPQGAVSADDLRARVLTQARAWNQLDAQSVALWLPDSIEFLVAFLALALAGKRIVLPHTLQAGASVQMAEHFDALVVDTPLPVLSCPQYSPAELIARTSSELGRTELNGEYCYDTPIDITLFTSGSTGLPQPVRKTLRELEAEVAVLAQDFPSVGTAAVIASVSHHHIYGLLHVLLWPLVRGAAFVTEPAQYPEVLIEQLAQYGPAVWVASPTHLTRMPDSELFSQANRQLVEFFSSGGLLTEAASSKLVQTLGFSPIEVLGSTETGGVAWRRQNDSRRWRALSGVKLTQSARGCLLVCSGHLDLPHAFEMGDKVGAFDANGFELLGRVDSVVKVEGKRLSLTELEARLSESPWVQECRAAVIRGRRDEVGIVATLTAAGSQELERAGKHKMNIQLRHFLSDFFDRPVIPRRWRYLEQMPRNAQGKILMSEIIGCLEERHS